MLAGIGQALGALALAFLPAAQEYEDDVLELERLFVATADAVAVDTVLDVRGGPPWSIGVAGTTDGGRHLRQFGNALFVVHTAGGSMVRIPTDGSAQQFYSFGAGTDPQDVYVHDSPLAVFQAYVTLRDDPSLQLVDLATGNRTPIVDLSPVGGGQPIALGTMENDGSRLFVQVRVFASGTTPTAADTGVLAVVDLNQHVLVDVDPLQAGIQGIALDGAPPHLKMQHVEATRTLFVSTTDGTLDNRGGIEMVDLDTLRSVGFALSEPDDAIGDLGGFVMTTPDSGYFVFHTDFAASTHLKRFTVQHGPDPGPEIVVFLGDTVDVITHDPVRGRIFLPTGTAGFARLIYVVDTTNKDRLRPIALPRRPYDVILAE